MLSKVSIVPDITVQFCFVLFLVLIPHLFQFLLPQMSILSFINYLLPVQLLVYLRKKQHQPLRQLKQLIVITVLRYLQSQQKLENQTTIVENVHTLFETNAASQDLHFRLHLFQLLGRRRKVVLYQLSRMNIVKFLGRHRSTVTRDVLPPWSLYHVIFA